MVKRLCDWIVGWQATLAIRFRHPELYRYLTQPHDPADFTEVGPPT